MVTDTPSRLAKMNRSGILWGLYLNGVRFLAHEDFSISFFSASAGGCSTVSSASSVVSSFTESVAGVAGGEDGSTDAGLSGTSAMAVAFVTNSSLTRVDSSGVVISTNEQELQTLSLFLIVEKVPVVAQQARRENKGNGQGAHF